MAMSRKETRARVNKLLSSKGQGSSEDRASSVCDPCCPAQLSPCIFAPFPYPTLGREASPLLLLSLGGERSQ